MTNLNKTITDIENAKSEYQKTMKPYATRYNIIGTVGFAACCIQIIAIFINGRTEKGLPLIKTTVLMIVSMVLICRYILKLKRKTLERYKAYVEDRIKQQKDVYAEKVRFIRTESPSFYVNKNMSITDHYNYYLVLAYNDNFELFLKIDNQDEIHDKAGYTRDNVLLSHELFKNKIQTSIK